MQLGRRDDAQRAMISPRVAWWMFLEMFGKGHPIDSSAGLVARHDNKRSCRRNKLFGHNSGIDDLDVGSSLLPGLESLQNLGIERILLLTVAFF
jgi:hypothetical protein